MKKTKLVLLCATLACFFVVTKTEVGANEGTAELRSTTSDDFRCFVASIQMQDYKYRVLVSCRNILYPASDEVFNYVLWAVGGNGDTFKFGPLGLGRASFNTANAFSTLFVTTERNAKTKNPTGPRVMQGSIQPIRFLEVPTTPTPTNVPGEGEEPQQTAEEQLQEPDTQQLTTRERLILGLRRAGIVSLLALVAIIGLVFVITRSRG